MPRPSPTVPLFPALAALVAAIAVTWFVARRGGAPDPVPPLPEATATTVAIATPIEPAVAPATASPGPAYRLAGTVVGDRLFAVIEAPDGSNELYAIGADVPQLGKLVVVAASYVTFEGEQGRYDMPLQAGATPTPGAPAATVDAYEIDDGGEYDEDDDYYADEPIDRRN